MSENELLEENKKLKEEVKQLKKLLENRIMNTNTTAYGVIASLIADKVNKEVHESFNHCKQTLKRKIMDDVKWELHVRYTSDFIKKHIEPAKEFINNYEIEDFYKKERNING